MVETKRFELSVRPDNIGDATLKFSIHQRGGVNGYPKWYQVRVDMNDGAGKALHNTLSPDELVTIAQIMREASGIAS